MLGAFRSFAFLNGMLFLVFWQTGMSCACADDKIDALRQKAEGGDAKAQYDLGVIYWMGKKVRKDYAQARVWLEKAAAKGSAESQVLLGVMEYHGQGGPRNDAKAAEWMTKAATSGNAGGQLQLGMYKACGVGVEKNLEDAYFWLMLARKEPWYARTAMPVINGFLAWNLTKEQIAAAEKKAAEFKPAIVSCLGNTP